jgi:hypothetical protein
MARKTRVQREGDLETVPTNAGAEKDEEGTMNSEQDGGREDNMDGEPPPQGVAEKEADDLDLPAEAIAEPNPSGPNAEKRQYL